MVNNRDLASELIELMFLNKLTSGNLLVELICHLHICMYAFSGYYSQGIFLPFSLLRGI